MPRCRICRSTIRTGRYCIRCKREQRQGTTGGTGGPEAIECNNCDGKSYIKTPDGTEDCPVCDGIGLVVAIADGGHSTMDILGAIDMYHTRAIEAESRARREFWQRHRDQMEIALIERGRRVRGEEVML